MQITDMKAIKSLCNPKSIFFLNPTKSHLCLHHRSRHLHSTVLRLLATTDSDFIDNTQNAPQVWSTYNPISPAIVSTNSITSNKIRASDSELESLSDYGDRDSDQEKEEFVNEKRNQSAEKDDLANERVSFSSSYKKKGKSRVIYVCENCGNEYGQWWGSCRSCGKVATLKQMSKSDVNGSQKFSGSGGGLHVNITRSWLPQKSSETRPLRLKDVNQRIDQLNWRIPLPGVFGTEVARVLGGGIIPGSLILVGGDPGVGKSTMLLQIAALIAEGQAADKRDPVVYVSGEESVEQIVNRADRLRIGAEELFLYSSTDIEDVLEKIQPLSPCALMIDSIQTAYIQGVTGSAGGITQVKECTSALLRFAKKTNIPVFLIGHVTKSGDIAGPRVLEHIVDVVLYLEGEKHLSHRLLRTVKNRFGSTDELGVFEMSHSGLQTVSNASEIFLTEQYSGSEILAGLAVAVIMDGSRSFLIEIQALCTTGSSGSRLVNGLQPSRANMIISVLKRQANLKLQDCDIFLNVVSGVSLTETAGDLAIAAAICSSFMEYPIPSNVAFIGEIGLGGELRMVPRIEKRVHTVAKLGYKMCVVPKSAKKYLSGLDFEGIQIIGCANLKQVIDAVFTWHN